ncbi:MAG: hypothetical protein NUV90_03005 [Candidatus Parcubacteria bacterium]|nr:hypothetical protein [Candidatus Parcubacteria bacterium]
MTVPLLLEALLVPYELVIYYKSKKTVSYNLFALGILSMNGSMSIIGSVIASVLIGGTVVYDGRHDAVVASHDPLLVGTPISGVVLAATSSIAATGIASDMTSSTVTLHGAVYPHEAEISYWFEYTSDPRMGLILIRRTPRVLLVTSLKQKLVEANVSGLMKSTKYYFRIVTEDSAGIVRGERVSFNTP